MNKSREYKLFDYYILKISKVGIFKIIIKIFKITAKSSKGV